MYKIRTEKKVKSHCVGLTFLEKLYRLFFWTVFGQNMLKTFKLKAFSVSLVGFESRTGHQQKSTGKACAFLLCVDTIRIDFNPSGSREEQQSCDDTLREVSACGVSEIPVRVIFAVDRTD